MVTSFSVAPSDSPRAVISESIATVMVARLHSSARRLTLMGPTIL